MTITVLQTVGLPASSPVAQHALPTGFPIVIIEQEQKVLEHILLFQIAGRLVSGKRNWKKNTTLAEAFDLRDWFAYLEHVTWADPDTKEERIGKPWDLATQEDYINYRDTQQYLISPITNRPYESSTIARRQGAVARFYRHAEKEGWYTGVFLKDKVKKGRTAPTNSIELAHISSRSSVDEISPYQEPVEARESVSALTFRHWELIKKELGPLPTQQGKDECPVRDRLAAELSITTGMRVDEVASLIIVQILDLHNEWLLLDEEERDEGYIKLYITKTKRLNPRNVLVPCYLVQELMAYLDGERKDSVEAGRLNAKYKGTKYKEPSFFFINHSNTGRNAGNTVSPTSLSAAFKKACINAGITRTAKNIDHITYEPFYVAVSAHSFHDLRHSFAVWKYHAEVARGNSEPWKEIQILLGHKFLQTTMDTYLAVVEIERQTAGALQYHAKKNLGNQDA